MELTVIKDEQQYKEYLEWTDKPLPWLQELLWQNVKNVAKRVLVAWR